jgi:O-antigen ligase
MAAQDTHLLSVPAQRFGALALAWVLLDSMLTYFLRQWTGSLPPVNALLVVILAVIVLRWGLRAILPPAHAVILLLAAVIATLSSKIIQGGLEINQAGEVVLSVCVFLVAFFAFRWSDNAGLYRNLFLAVALAYVAVCVIALLHMAPGMFPVVNAVWSNNGALIDRPEITTDQNFQVYYLLPLALLIALPYKPLRSSLAVIGVVGALFVLARLQTRSGFLIFSATVALALMAPLWTASLGRRKILFLPLLALAALAYGFDAIMHASSLLIARFNSDDDNTALSRLLAFMFTVEHIADPNWWLPRGTQEFVRQYGYVPHSNITAIYVEGGLIGLVMWAGVFVLPLLALTRLFLRRRLDELATLVLLGGIASMVIQLSLNVPFFKQPWLWAGAVIGTLARVRAAPQPRAEEASPPSAAQETRAPARYAATRGSQ